MSRMTIVTILALFLVACIGKDQNKKSNQISKNMIADSTKQYGYNLEFLKKYVDVIELKNGNSLVALVPAWQGRVMTSTSEGTNGFSFGWINRELISEGKTLPHINPYGGEERLWLGPEGGQFSIFFKKGVEFIYDNWQTPAFLDTMPYEINALTDSSVMFSQNINTENYSSTLFNLKLKREVILLSGKQILEQTGIDTKGLNCVAYRSENKIINEGINEWKKESGLLSVWMLGMFNPSPDVIIVIPFKPGDEKELGTPVNDNYFGKISGDRLKVSGNNIFFRADGKSRGKIGIPPLRTTGIMGSYDFNNNALTLLICKLPDGKKEYVNSAWQLQDNPYSGDALNAYNDGPLEDGSQMGPFYELETSSPAAALKPGESMTHSQVTIHITGDKKLISNITTKIFGVTLDSINRVFN